MHDCLMRYRDEICMCIIGCSNVSGNVLRSLFVHVQLKLEASRGTENSNLRNLITLSVFRAAQKDRFNLFLDGADNMSDSNRSGFSKLYACNNVWMSSAVGSRKMRRTEWVLKHYLFMEYCQNIPRKSKTWANHGGSCVDAKNRKTL